MEITPRELRDMEIHSEIRGYSRDEVNDLLERAAVAIEASNQRVAQMQDRLTSAQSEAVRTRETEDILHRTLLLAQRAADEAVAEATAKSRQMLDEAEMSSRRLVADSEAEARRKGEAERRRLEQEILELAGRRDALLADVEALTRFEAEYRERMVRALETDLTSLRTRPTTAPGSKPETTDVDIPEAILTGSTAPEPAQPERNAPASEAPANGIAPSSGAPSTATPATAAAAAAPSEPVPVAENGRAPASADAPVADGPDGESPVAVPGRGDAVGAATSEVDVRTLFEQSHDAPKPAAPVADTADTADTAPPATGRPAGFQPIDLAGSDAVDADILDDDAFFATLRDAVHDDAPLGPREEGDDITGENRFFDQDAERGTFRDVFRRRR